MSPTHSTPFSLYSAIQIPDAVESTAAFMVTPAASFATTASEEKWLESCASAALAPDERATWAAMAFRGHRQLQWLLGRLAAKAVVQEIMRTTAGVTLALPDVTVTSGVGGAPRIELPPEIGVPRPPLVSISHSGVVGAALGSVDDRSMGVGIDIEHERPLRYLERKGLSDTEILAIDRLGGPRTELVLRFWTAKEAAVKSLGLNLDEAGGPKSVMVTPVTAGASELRVDVAARAGGVALRRVTAFTQRRSGYVIATVLDPGSARGDD